MPDLVAAIEALLEAHNDDPRPFVWTASVEAILEKGGRCKAVLETVYEDHRFRRCQRMASTTIVLFPNANV